MEMQQDETHPSNGAFRPPADNVRFTQQQQNQPKPQSRPVRHPLFPNATLAASTSGLALKSGAPRTDADIKNDRVKLKRFKRGVGYAKDKAMDCLCDKANLKFKFAVPDYS
eukprot:scaffold112213_cov44-Cyclotella_meneghiniana.AAC.10